MRLRTRSLAFASVFALALFARPAVSAAAEPHPFDVRDLIAMDRVSDPQASPKGDRIVFSLRRLDAAANRGRVDLWMVGSDGSDLRQLTSHPDRDAEARWAPDGKSVYFLSTRSGSSQVWRLAIDGGEPSQVTHLPLDVASLEVSPDGKTLAFSLEVFPDCANLDCTTKRLAERSSSKASGQIYDELFIRHWDTWGDGRRNHLFTMSLANPAAAPIDLTQGMKADVPSKPFGDAAEYTFSRDGKTVIFSARQGGSNEAWSTNFDLFEVPSDGSSAAKKITNNPAWDTHPTFSPDGKSLAYLAMARPGFEADRFHIVLRDLSTGQERFLAEAWDRTPNELIFSRDGKTIYASALDLGHQPLFAIDIASGAIRRVVAGGSVHAPVLAGDRLVFGLDDMKAPTELYSVKLDGKGLTALTKFNAEKMAAVTLGEPEQFSFAGAGGATVYGWVVKPAGFDATKKYPIAFIIHGGPQGSVHDEFHYRWNPQIYAAKGYAAIAIDFHGSTGYGQAFTDAISTDWGGKPLEDLQKGLAAALAKYPWLDGERACALGASYGGFMINWIAGNWPDGFRCLVNHDGIFDQRTMYYGTEEVWFPEWEQGGPYYEKPESHERWNPAAHVTAWKTPMLVVHGALDYRVPDLQGISTFTALQRRGVPSRFLYFPDENHWVLKPANSVLWHDTVLDWMGRWLTR